MARMVIIADDLTGAADSAASSAARGCRAAVLLHSPDRESEADGPDTDIVSIDTNSRCVSAEQAWEMVAQIVRQCDSRNSDRQGYVLFKKIDSTLRGHVAVELSALLEARRFNNPGNAKLSILLAPALPPQGRTTVGGRVLVYGLPLEETDIWKTEVGTAQSDIRELLAKAGLSCGIIDIETVRSGLTCLHRAISQIAEQKDVVVCDAETDEDLGAIAAASASQPALTALVGSAGLARQVAHAIGVAAVAEVRDVVFAEGPTLFLVGTAASVSKQQARMLEAIADVATFHAAPPALQTSPGITCSEIVQTLRTRRDVLLILNEDEICSSGQWQLPDLMRECEQFLGGIVVTGGATARTVLEALGIRRLRLLGEVESGLPISVAESWVRSLLVITKAGAFGSPQALVRCREFVRELERMRGNFQSEDLLKARET